MRNTHEPEPLLTINEGRCLILDMPPMSDEAAYQLSEVLRKLAETFDEVHFEQLLRAYREREDERKRLYHERRMREAQQWLPFEDELDDELPF